MTSRPLLLVALFAAACAAPDQTGPTEVPQLGQGDIVYVPIKGRAYGYSFGIVPAANCPVGWRRTGLDMTGEASLLGHTVFTAQHCNVGTQAIGGATMTGANGDALSFTYTLVSVETVSGVPPFVHRFRLAATFDGGTGRFEGATGTATFNCLRTIPLNPATLPAHTPAYASIYDCKFSGKVSQPGA